MISRSRYCLNLSKGITICFRRLLNLACTGCTPLSPVLILLILTFTGKEIGLTDIARVCNAVGGWPEQNIIARQFLRLLGIRGKTTGEREYLGMVRYFKQRQKEGDNYYFAIDLCSCVTLCSIFWADGRSGSAYLQFCDVLVCDVSDKTNNLECSLHHLLL